MNVAGFVVTVHSDRSLELAVAVFAAGCCFVVIVQ